MSTDERRTAVIDGIRQVYRVRGEGPLCLVHAGGPGIDPAYLRLPGLEGRLTMVYLDPVGSGESDLLPDGDYSMSRYGRFARGVLDDLGEPSAHLLGHSHGGFVGLQFAIDSPGRLKSLILYDTAPVFTPELTEAGTREMQAYAARYPDRPEAAEALRQWTARVTGTLIVDDDESHRRFLGAIMPAYFKDLRKTEATLGRKLLLDVVHDPNRHPVSWDVRGQLGAITVPTLVIAGEYDFVCPPCFSEEMAEAIPNAGLRLFRDSGHFAHLEEPEAFAAALTGFAHTVETRS